MGFSARTVAGAIAPSLLALTTLFGISAGCGGASGAGESPRSRTGDLSRDTVRPESTFRPSDYGIETWKDDTASHPAVEPDGDVAPLSDTAWPDTIPGFRVQVAITEDIDAAAKLRDVLSAELADEWVYVVHHPPYYKVRVGDFGERHLASGLLDDLKHRGYPDAWIVPDRVLRTPPAKPVPSDSAAADSAR